MSSVVKLISVLTVSGGLLGALNAPAHALSIIAPAEPAATLGQGSTYNNAPIAFTSGADGAATQDNFLLSPAEIMHVRWCAQQYASYHASDNTYATSRGDRVECRSPH